MQPTDDETESAGVDEALLLRLRADRYARRDRRAAGAELRVLAFARGNSSYAIALDALREVRSWPKLCVVPGASSAVPGVFQYRGELLSAHDPGRFMGLEMRSTPQWMLVLEHARQRIGLMADEVAGIRSVASDGLQPVPVAFGERGRCFLGVIEPHLLVLDAPRLFDTKAFFAAF